MAIEPRGADILVRTAPPLSATTDMPLASVAEPPVSASNNEADQAAGAKPEMAPEAQAEARAEKRDGSPSKEGNHTDGETDKSVGTEASARNEADTTGEEGVDPNLPAYAKREITKARNRQRAAEAAAAEATKQAQEAAAERSRLLKLTEDLVARTPETVEQPDPKPVRTAFESPESYDAALIEWGTREGERRATKAATEKAEADRLQVEKDASDKAADAQRAAADAEIARLNTDWAGKKAKAVEKYPDYAEVAERDDLQISMPMAHAMMLSENGADIAYHLGQNPEEASRIAAIANPGMQIFEIGKIAQQLAAPAVRQSAAPRPIAPIRGSNAAADSSDAEPSMEAWAAKRTPEILSARSPFVPTKH